METEREVRTLFGPHNNTWKVLGIRKGAVCQKKKSILCFGVRGNGDFFFLFNPNNLD